MLDLLFASLHHFIVFALVATVLAELAILRRDMDAQAVRRVAAVDAWYGILAGAILAVGFARAVLAAKGWDYYAANAFFWAKIGTFAAIGLLSIGPTLAYLRWRRSGIVPDAAAVARVRRLLMIELALFAPLLVFAAAMARGYG